MQSGRGRLRLRRSERRAQRLRSAESRCQVARSIHRKTFGSAPGGEAAPAQKNKMLQLFMARLQTGPCSTQQRQEPGGHGASPCCHPAATDAWGSVLLSPNSQRGELQHPNISTHPPACYLCAGPIGQTPSLAFGRCGMLKEGTRDTGVKACTTIWALTAPEMPPATRCCCVSCILPQIIHHRATEEQDLLRALCSCAFTRTPRVWW